MGHHALANQILLIPKSKKFKKCAERPCEESCSCLIKK